MLVVKISQKMTWCVVQCAFVMFHSFCLQFLPCWFVVEFGLFVEFGFSFTKFGGFVMPSAGLGVFYPFLGVFF